MSAVGALPVVDRCPVCGHPMSWVEVALAECGPCGQCLADLAFDRTRVLPDGSVAA